MSLPFLIAAAPRSVLFTTPTGQTHVLTASHPHFAVASNLVRAAEAARRDGDPNVVAAVMLLLSNLAGLSTAGRAIKPPALGGVDRHGRFVVTEQDVQLDGEVLRSPVADRVLWMKQHGLDYAPLLAFAANLMENPARRPVEDLFDYVDSRGLAIDAEGYVLGYEALGEPVDPETGPREPGRTITVRRNRTEEDPLRPCPTSLKVGPFPVGTTPAAGTLLPVVRVHPRDVVAVPVGTGPLRCCAMNVVALCDPAAKLPAVAVSAAWAARGLEEEEVFTEAAAAPAAAVQAQPEAKPEPAEGRPEQKLGFFTRAMVRLHDAVEGAGKAAAEPKPHGNERSVPTGATRPATS